MCAKVFKAERARQSHALGQLPPLHSPPRGRSACTPTAPTHPWHTERPPQRCCRSSSPAHCLCLHPTWRSSMLWISSLPPPDQHQLFAFLHVNTWFAVQPPARSFPLQLRAQPQVGFPWGSLPWDTQQTPSRMCSLDVKCQAQKSLAKHSSWGICPLVGPLGLLPKRSESRRHRPTHQTLERHTLYMRQELAHESHTGTWTSTWRKGRR